MMFIPAPIQRIIWRLRSSKKQPEIAACRPIQTRPTDCLDRLAAAKTLGDESSALKTLTRDDLAEAVRVEIGLSRSESRRLVDLVLQTGVQVLERGEDVKLPKFGVFGVRNMGERAGRNPKTGEAATIIAPDPTQLMFIISLIIAAAAALIALGVIPSIPIASVWVMGIGYAVLAAGCLFNGV
jgi:integration host factor subunit alpha